MKGTGIVYKISNPEKKMRFSLANSKLEDSIETSWEGGNPHWYWMLNKNAGVIASGGGLWVIPTDRQQQGKELYLIPGIHPPSFPSRLRELIVSFVLIFMGTFYSFIKLCNVKLILIFNIYFIEIDDLKCINFYSTVK